MLRSGQLSADEYSVSEPATKAGAVIANRSAFEPLVMLKHFLANSEVPGQMYVWFRRRADITEGSLHHTKWILSAIY